MSQRKVTPQGAGNSETPSKHSNFRGYDEVMCLEGQTFDCNITGVTLSKDAPAPVVHKKENKERKRFLKDGTDFADIAFKNAMQQMMQEGRKSSFVSICKQNPQLKLHQFITFYYNLDMPDAKDICDATFEPLLQYVPRQVYSRYDFECSLAMNDEERVELYLADKGFDVGYKSQYPIKFAARYSNQRIVEMLLKHPDVDPTVTKNVVFKVALKAGNIEALKAFSNDSRIVLDQREASEALVVACQVGDVDFVRELMECSGVDVMWLGNYPIRAAIKNGHDEIVDLLLDSGRVDPSFPYNTIVENVCRDGKVDVLKKILKFPGVDPTGNKNYALNMASQNGHFEVVKLLLEDGRVDPSAFNKEAERVALGAGHTDIVGLLHSKYREIVRSPRSRSNSSDNLNESQESVTTPTSRKVEQATISPHKSEVQMKRIESLMNEKPLKRSLDNTQAEDRE